MTSHVFHPDVHDYGLADDCPRCAELAERPLDSLDTDCLQDLFRRIRTKEPARSEAEARAMSELERAERLAEMARKVRPL